MRLVEDALAMVLCILDEGVIEATKVSQVRWDAQATRAGKCNAPKGM